MLSKRIVLSDTLKGEEGHPGVVMADLWGPPSALGWQGVCLRGRHTKNREDVRKDCPLMSSLWE